MRRQRERREGQVCVYSIWVTLLSLLEIHFTRVGQGSVVGTIKHPVPFYFEYLVKCLMECRVFIIKESRSRICFPIYEGLVVILP